MADSSQYSSVSGAGVNPDLVGIPLGDGGGCGDIPHDPGTLWSFPWCLGAVESSVCHILVFPSDKVSPTRLPYGSGWQERSGEPKGVISPAMGSERRITGPSKV